jgi:hypothetical protein
MRTLKLSTVAARCALGTVICFVAGAVAMRSSGVGVLILETGRPGLDWIAASHRVHADSGAAIDELHLEA